MKHQYVLALLMAAFLPCSGALFQTCCQLSAHETANQHHVQENVVVEWISTDVRHTAGTPIGSNSITPQRVASNSTSGQNVSDVSGFHGKAMTLTAWRGERVSAQLAVSTPKQLDSLIVQVEPLRNGKNTIGTQHIHAAFVDYVMTDGLKTDGSGGCGYRNSADYDSSMVADIIDTEMRPVAVAAGDACTCWLSVDVPADVPAGLYKGLVTVSCDKGQLSRLSLSVKVTNRVLPPSSQWAFHLDLWQNPYAVARYYNVEPFTPEHFELMRPIMQHYAAAGGKVITASITHKPWNGQTYDPFESMVTWVHCSDGKWLYDYTMFDSWVEFMMSLGVREQINCYSMVPWRLSFQYFDMATGRLRSIACKPGEAAYEEFWGTMLKDFAHHLREKGWFDITHIAMDERSLSDMLATLRVIKNADAHFKVSLAGTYHDELVEVLDDYCITLAEEFPATMLKSRKESGLVSTYYTCCQEREPNTFTFSSPAEAEWLAWHAAAERLDGYLRWAFNSWVRDPLHDSRFTAWPAGDTYLVYPDGKTSVRMERLKQGIQQYEKVRILREQLPAAKRAKLDAVLQMFRVFNPSTHKESLHRARLLINSL